MTKGLTVGSSKTSAEVIRVYGGRVISVCTMK